MRRATMSSLPQQLPVYRVERAENLKFNKMIVLWKFFSSYPCAFCVARVGAYADWWTSVADQATTFFRLDDKIASDGAIKSDKKRVFYI